MDRTYTTYYLEMMSATELRPKPLPAELQIIECEVPQPELNRFLYQLVGKQWEWSDLDTWSIADWQALVEQPCHRTWVAYYKGAIAGYYELHQAADFNVEIRYFGLAPQFLSRGFGGPLLSHAIESAWAWPETRRAWVHTCTLDHPAALANYQARGFRIFRQETALLD
ncbi:GNAT family N-acetyltransferase [Pseudomonas sp. FeN3W]|jgi:GNAT superfamily N-acetyltransferase|uniref:N-acetyltransferase GCN5 n=1 Tax=Stutzerimonas stutzeri NF13 TaxID=1212548 RepID=M2V2G8_STUST|nr:GNAT family N-acetyltransferase [Stutzerimonas stutzeri]EMD99996.1 N-acetyltransferase GCN5 [Stutzerimonas stutzeri NF13]MBS67918.1 N-acetyltransferase [Pseudomonas sp.]MCQ4290018.1 GNAT family N-acetyltransferase [Stutzerimonas stutzeri]WOF78427.1 GNAT family N-acetyltransferase [Pseudomonas sp. FeN3W]|tara:strand:+ start:8111 stop:8614 length:504 start_codon:yes stop_codon:yes gene_type:complete